MAKIKSGAVRVDGLAEFRSQLKGVDDKELVKEFKQANYDIADEVVQHARFNAATVSRMAFAASETLRAARSGYQAEISLANKRGFELGAEFGASRNKTRNLPGGRRVRGWNQFKPWRGSDNGAGYFLFPALRDISDDAVQKYNKRLGEITAKAFPD
jgi:hypothetical protein